MFWKDLTKTEKKHVREMGMRTLESFKRNANSQAEIRKEFPKTEPCWDCRFIAKKLGLPI